MSEAVTEKEPMIEAKGLRKVYPVEDDPVVALDDVSLYIRKGEICCIYGQSGSGKSTLLNQLAGLEKPTKGKIRINHQIITDLNEEQLSEFRQKNIGFVFQSYNLIPSMTALENTALPLMFMGIDEKTRKKRAKSILKLVNLENRILHYPRQMSGGQQQRVGIARAFITKPAVIFADEPTGNLDSKSSRDIMNLIYSFSRRLNLTIVMVSHDEQTARYADHIIKLQDGKIIEEFLQTPDPEIPEESE